MTDSTEDFAAMFEASIKAKRFEKGQTLEGTVVAIGPEVAFVDVGGKGEATIEVDELKDADGDLEVAVGDRIQAMVVSTSGGLTLSRKPVAAASVTLIPVLGALSLAFGVWYAAAAWTLAPYPF